jgi:hypothetical protein
MGAVQSQDYPGATWGLGLRTDGSDRAAIDAAFNAGRLLRTHVLRPTWHFVAPEDIRWLLALTGPRVLAGAAGRLRQLELDEAILRRGDDLLAESLERGRSMTRRELGAAFSARGIDPGGQRLPYFLMHGELTGLICSGPLQGRQHTFALLDDRVPPAPPKTRDEAVTELVRRYVRSHGPATVHDFAWWSGLTVSDGRRGLEALGGDVEKTELEGKTYWSADESPAAGRRRGPAIHLLPNYDELTVAYRDHAPSIDARARAVFVGWAAGVLGNVVALDGLIVGSWRRSLAKDRAIVALDLAVPLADRERDALDDAAVRLGRFLRLSISLTGAG